MERSSGNRQGYEGSGGYGSERYNTSEEDNALKQKPFQTFSMDRLCSTRVNEVRF